MNRSSLSLPLACIFERHDPIFVGYKQPPITMNATTELSKVYKANQCCDASDFQYAMDEVRRIAHKYGWTPALLRRMVSLVKASKP